ncbi:uncharacterized protein B0P05DRAFT_295288 [Gilbertella persicaria]|uniref:uncharacterized protein n=1 Tax=Gilbertella persicaria TaxID=101096 RepID=UPI00221F1339|nr:uncharacterized protein B0P05DRAFT_295288 [Gilbertella persicaria]KAI8090978.1 hypothetical protein B0P05DRAFT_295288 [Gilbertella persicaria]
MNQPPNNDSFESELEAIENAMNSMMQGAFSMMFRELTSGSGIFESIESSFPGMTEQVTTILDGKALDTKYAGHQQDDVFGGNDFKRLANKSKYKNLESIQEKAVMPNHSIFDLLLPHAVFTRQDNTTSTPLNNHNNHTQNENGWSFTSSSQRTIYHPDGTQETILTKKTNGNTETTTYIRYPDGRTEETREQKSSIWNKLWWK